MKIMNIQQYTQYNDTTACVNRPIEKRKELLTYVNRNIEEYVYYQCTIENKIKRIQVFCRN